MPHTLFPRADAATKARLEADELVRLADNFGWAETELGPIATWPEALRASVRLMMVSDVPMVMLAGERDGVLIYNSGYAQFAGDRHPLIFGKPALEAWPEIADFNREVMRRGFLGESWYVADQELVLNRTGRFEPLWLNLNYSPVLDESGTPLGVVVLVVETTARVRAEMALAKSQEKLNMALTASGMVGTWDWDVGADLVTADERFARLYCLAPDEAERGFPMSTFLAAIHPDDRERAQTELQAAVATRGQARFEFRLLQSDGSIRWVAASGAVSSPKGLRFPGIVVDITEQRLTAERLAESEARFRTLSDAMPQMVWSTLPDGFHDYYNARWYEFTGVPVGSTDGEGWNGMFHPEDQERAWSVWRMSLATGEPYRIEYRLRHHSGAYRWVLGQALPVRNATGEIIRWIGTCTDIHEGRLAAEEREIIAQELSHRIKNIFAVIGGLVSLAARQHPEATAFADRLRSRILALGRAHDFVRPHSRASQPRSNPSSLKALVLELLDPYQDADQSRVTFSGDDATIDEGAATPLALLFHELATNAAKYGALSRPEGRIEIAASSFGENYSLHWHERGGPAVAEGTQGFGSRLIKLSVEGQLRGTLQRNWTPEGLDIDLVVPLDALKRRADLRPSPEPKADQKA
ncbi:PAS domain-containing protein [Devosia sp.]|uniref:PAS domain-containing sensor histidine kinase n=1 Tax=Devosia sp. TaxID=1871048 RepID=UPI003BAC2A93